MTANKYLQKYAFEGGKSLMLSNKKNMSKNNKYKLGRCYAFLSI